MAQLHGEALTHPDFLLPSWHRVRWERPTLQLVQVPLQLLLVRLVEVALLSWFS
jgi:hypothetical protein